MQYDYRTLDDVIHARVRLAIMSFLATANTADFNALKSALKVSDGNLSTHLKKLEDHNYIAVEKRFQNKKPQTTISITPRGKKAFEAYVEGLANMLNPT